MVGESLWRVEDSLGEGTETMIGVAIAEGKEYGKGIQCGIRGEEVEE